MQKRALLQTFIRSAVVLAAGAAFGVAHAQTTPIKFQLDWRFEGPAALFTHPAAKGYFKDAKLDVAIDAGNGSGGTVTRVASGAYDVAMAVGVEKVKDSGYQGLNAFPIPNDGTTRTLTAAGSFSMVAPAYAEKYGVPMDQLKRTLARIASKNHYNGARNPRAQFRREMSVDQICAMPAVAGDLSVFDCAGVADGSAAAIVVRAEDAHRYTDHPIYIKALSFVAGNGSGLVDPDYDYTWFPEIATCAADAYHQAGIADPASRIAMAEVHDCFTPTELVLMEDLGFSERGTAWRDIEAGRFDLGGELPVNPDGGLKSFGHPVGASGLRMMFEAWLQLRGEAPEDRTISSISGDRNLALTHNLGGYPGEMVSFISILGPTQD